MDCKNYQNIKSKMFTTPAVFLLLMTSLCVTGLPPYATDVEENLISNETYTHSDAEDLVNSSQNKRDISLSPSSPETTKLAVELLSKAIDNILMNITQMQSIVQDVQTQLVNHGQVSQNAKYQVVLSSDRANQNSALGLGQGISQSSVHHSQVSESQQNVAHTAYSSVNQANQNNYSGNAVQNANVQITGDDSGLQQIAQALAQASSQKQFGVYNQLSANNVHSYGQSAQLSQVSQSALNSLESQNVQESNNYKKLINVGAAGHSSQDQNQISSTQNIQNGILDAQQLENQDLKQIQTLEVPLNSNFGQYNQISSTNVGSLGQGHGLSSQFQGSWTAQNNWGGSQIGQYSQQSSADSADLNWTGPTNTWKYQNTGIANQNNVLNAQQSYDALHSGQSSVLNQVQSNNLLQPNQVSQGSVSQNSESVTDQNQDQLNIQAISEAAAIQTQQNVGSDNQLSSSGGQVIKQGVENSSNSAQNYQKHDNLESPLSQEINSQQSIAHSQTNVLNAQQSSSTVNTGQSSTQSQVQSHNLLQANLQAYPEDLAPETQSGIAANNQLPSSGVQGIEHTEQNSNNLQTYHALEGLTGQQTWNGAQSVQQSQISQGAASQQTVAHGAANWNEGVSNWQHQNVGISSQNSQANVISGQQSSGAANSAQSSIHNQVQSHNLLQTNQGNQGSVSQNTGSATNQNQDQLIIQTFPGLTESQTQQNLGPNNQLSSGSIQGVGQRVQNFNKPQTYQGYHTLESSTAQNSWNAAHTAQQGQISQGIASQQNIAHGGANWNQGSTNWQYQTAGGLSQNNHHNAQQSFGALANWNTLQGQTNAYQGSANLGSLGYTNNLLNQANIEGVRQNAHSYGYYNKEQVANKEAKYHFATKINDNINGNYQERNEHRSGGKITGFYSYDDGNIFRTVSYVADDKGYRILSDDIKPSKKAETPLNGVAEVKLYNNGTSTEYSVKGDEIGSYNQGAARGDVPAY